MYPTIKLDITSREALASVRDAFWELAWVLRPRRREIRWERVQRSRMAGSHHRWRAEAEGWKPPPRVPRFDQNARRA